MELNIPGIGPREAGSPHPRTEPAARPDLPRRTAEEHLDEGRKSPDYEKFLNQILQMVPLYDRELKFVVNRKLGEVVVKVVDTKTDKVIKEIPPVEIQRLEARIREAVGLLIDEKI